MDTLCARMRRSKSQGVDLKLLSLPALAALGVLSGCSTEAHRRAAEAAAIQKEAAREIKRICALPLAERAAELERINKESGIVVQCGKD
jgi:hypothetical protein